MDLHTCKMGVFQKVRLKTTESVHSLSKTYFFLNNNINLAFTNFVIINSLLN